MSAEKQSAETSTKKTDARESESSKPSHFEICREMASRNLDIRMSLLENVTNLSYSKRTKGTTVSIGVDGDLVGAIFNNKFIGGLLLCDREQYLAISAELSASAPSPGVTSEQVDQSYGGVQVAPAPNSESLNDDASQGLVQDGRFPGAVPTQGEVAAPPPNSSLPAHTKNEPARDYDFHGNPPNLPARPELDKDEGGGS